MQDSKQNGITERPPVIVVTGHIDHGKSSLLDYIRKTNVVAGEAGGITQHTSAYEVTHKNERGEDKKITFLDTPGHEAFSAMRSRGVKAADIAILVVSAEDSVKAQTLEALKAILDGKIPYIVAINKIDKPAANPDKVKMDLAEHGVYVEGFGGNIPCVLISAKAGTGIPELLDIILLVAEMEELKGDTAKTAEGLVIESHMDQKRGITATLLILDGTLEKGLCLVADDSITPVRLIEDFNGKPVDTATFSSPILITGWNKMPAVGAKWTACASKKEAEAVAEENKSDAASGKSAMAQAAELPEGTVVMPIILRTDVAGTAEAIEKELGKIQKDGIIWKIAQNEVGNISESDIKLAGGLENALVIGFNVKTDKSAAELAERTGIAINNFSVIYKITEWLEEEMEKKRPRVTVEETTGTAKILKCFSATRDKQVVGGRVLSGSILNGEKVKIMRREFEIGRGEITELQQHKMKTGEVSEGEFGVLIESKTEIAPGDVIEAVKMVTK